MNRTTNSGAWGNWLRSRTTSSICTIRRWAVSASLFARHVRLRPAFLATNVSGKTRGGTERALIRTPATGDQRRDLSASEFCPPIGVHGDQMSGREGKAVPVEDLVRACGVRSLRIIDPYDKTNHHLRYHAPMLSPSLKVALFVVVVIFLIIRLRDLWNYFGGMG
jgi:hypothetical protein